MALRAVVKNYAALLWVEVGQPCLVSNTDKKKTPSFLP
jgi:hypothetical protein